jgi:uncharacterized protein YciU (UPF0263 family)
MRSQEYRWLVWSNGYQLFDPAMVDWKQHRADQLDEGALADAFYGLLDDPELRDVFRDLMVGDK